MLSHRNRKVEMAKHRKMEMAKREIGTAQTRNINREVTIDACSTWEKEKECGNTYVIAKSVMNRCLTVPQKMCTGKILRVPQKIVTGKTLRAMLHALLCIRCLKIFMGLRGRGYDSAIEPDQFCDVNLNFATASGSDLQLGMLNCNSDHAGWRMIGARRDLNV